MAVDLEQHILTVIRAMKPGDRPATIGDLSRRFGVNATVIAACMRQMVDSGAARPSMIDVSGVPVLHGLLPMPTPA
jgi:hypothetical protein